MYLIFSSICICFIFFAVSLGASIIGAISGIGGGLIIKPVLDAFGFLSIDQLNFLSGVTILAMTTTSLIRSRKNSVGIQINVALYLAIGSIVGGVVGKYIFDTLIKGAVSLSYMGAVQNIFIIAINIFVFVYVMFKSRITPHEIDNKVFSVVIGFSLGCISSFLGIGGGPLNLAVLFFFYGMETKQAAINSLFIIFCSQFSSLCTTLITFSVPNFKIAELIFMVAGGILGGIIGSYISKKISNKSADRFFQIVLIFISVLCVYNVFNYLYI